MLCVMHAGMSVALRGHMFNVRGPTGEVILFISWFTIQGWLTSEAVPKVQTYTKLYCNVVLHMHKPVNFRLSPLPSHPVSRQTLSLSRYSSRN
jgi:hypothetical protein